jgi:hypothetical protein
MRHDHEAFVAVAVLAFTCLGPVLVGSGTAKAEPALEPAAQQDSSVIAPDSPTRAVREKTKAKPKIARTDAAANPEGPMYLSPEWVKKEQQTNDKLKRMMNICKGC